MARIACRQMFTLILLKQGLLLALHRGFDSGDLQTLSVTSLYVEQHMGLTTLSISTSQLLRPIVVLKQNCSWLIAHLVVEALF